MRVKERIIEDLKESTENVLQAIDNTPDEMFNRQINGKWSASDHISHLTLLEKLILGVMQGERIPLEGREPDARIKVIERIFGDLDRKLHAPDALAPKEGDKDKERLIEQFSETRKQMISIIENEELDLLCLGFKHTFFKELTRYEWIYFTIYHSGRHAKQISSIH